MAMTRTSYHIDNATRPGRLSPETKCERAVALSVLSFGLTLNQATVPPYKGSRKILLISFLLLSSHYPYPPLHQQQQKQ